jgi:hypothetical protein
MVPFGLKRAVVLAVFGASFAWLNARNATPVPTPADSPVREPRQRAVEPAGAITPLHEWRPRNMARPARTRNVFAFGTAAAKSPTSPKRRVDSALLDLPPQVQPPPMPFKLVGLAEDASPTGPKRTAVISGAGQLFVVTDGEMVTSRYRVVAVSPDRVELTDLETASAVWLMFK